MASKGTRRGQHPKPIRTKLPHNRELTAGRYAAGLLLPSRYRQPSVTCASLMAGGVVPALSLRLAPPGFPLVGLSFVDVDSPSLTAHNGPPATAWMDTLGDSVGQIQAAK